MISAQKMQETRIFFVSLHPNLGNLNKRCMIAASVLEGFCTLIYGWEGEFGLPFLIT